MMRGLSEIRLGGVSLALLAVLSGAATVLIISGAGGRSAAQIAALAALRQRPVAIASHGSSPARTASSGSSSAPAPAAASSAGSGSGAPAASPSPTTTASSAGASTQSATPTSGSGTSAAEVTRASAASSLPKVGHVFEIALSTDSYEDAFGGRSAAPYLHSLESKGTLLSGFQSLGSSELADYLAMVSGQGPNADTSGDCTTYTDFPQSAAAQPDGIVRGDGCVYPETALTIGDQVTASGHVWRAYVADMGTQTCAHPNSNASDGAALPGTQPGYDTAHNPFIYFHSLLDLGDCATDDQDLSRLGPALARPSRTATFSFIAPGACDDSGSGQLTGSASANSAGTTTTTTSAPTTTTSAPTTTKSTPTTTTGAATPTAACPAGQPVGIAAENAFLRLWVPRILASPAYRHNGVLVIAFAATGHQNAARAIRTGALVLSRYARRGKKIRRTFGPYSLLRSIEQMLGYKPLAHARSAASFAAAVLRETK